jgi:hypothetical protein
VSDDWDDDDDVAGSTGEWVAGRGYASPGRPRRRMRSPLRRLRRLGLDVLRSARSRISVVSSPRGKTARARRRSMIGALIGTLEGPWGRLVLVAVMLQLAWWLAAPAVH